MEERIEQNSPKKAVYQFYIQMTLYVNQTVSELLGNLPLNKKVRNKIYLF